MRPWAGLLTRQRTNQTVANVLHTSVESQRMLGCSDETVSLVEGGRVVVHGVHHDETGCGNLPGGNCLSQCLGEKHCANAFSLL